MSTAAPPTLDMDKLNAFIGHFVTDLGAAVHTGMVVIGERLGLYKALAGGPMSSAELAAKTGTDERYLREWLASQAAGEYITYDEKTNKFSMSPEQAFTLANEDSPAYLPGAFKLALGLACSGPEDSRLISDRRRHGLARARRWRIPRMRKVLSTRLCSQPCELVDSGIGWREGEARSGWESG